VIFFTLAPLSGTLETPNEERSECDRVAMVVVVAVMASMTIFILGAVWWL
jgi:hypothetical protein